MKNLRNNFSISINSCFSCLWRWRQEQNNHSRCIPAPHAEILEKAKPLLKKKGYDLQIKTINDYTTPNKLLDKGEIDANFFQHTPYLKLKVKI